jgi:hypothetical protein
MKRTSSVPTASPVRSRQVSGTMGTGSAAGSTSSSVTNSPIHSPMRRQPSSSSLGSASLASMSSSSVPSSVTSSATQTPRKHPPPPPSTASSGHRSYGQSQTPVMINHDPKGRWSKMYMQRISDTQVHVDRGRETETWHFNQVAMSVVLLQRCAKRFKSRLYGKLAFARLAGTKQLSLEHFEWPTAPSEWQAFWGRNIHCYFCKQPTISDSITCFHCGSIAHRLCAVQDGRRFESGLTVAKKLSKKSMIKHLSQKKRTFTCDSCIKFYEEEGEYYHRCWDRLKAIKTRDYYKGVIAKALVFYVGRCRQLKREKAVQMLRNAMQRYSLVKMYHTWKRSCLRVIVLDVLSFPPIVTEMNDKCLIVLTVVDPVKHSQLFRIDRKPDVVIDEGTRQLPSPSS